MTKLSTMKQLLICFLGLLYSSSLVAQENPYSKYGYEPKIVTMSNGKFNEFHDQDTIVQIGRVVYNTKSMTILGFIEYDTLYAESDLSPDIVSRWLSPDPLAAKFPWQSPYVGFDNNPVFYIDPDGRAVIPANEQSKQGFQGALTKVYGSNEVGNSVGDLLVRQMNYVNTSDRKTGYSKEFTIVDPRDFKKSVKSAVKSGALSKDMANQAYDLFNVVSNDNQNFVQIQGMFTDDRTGAIVKTEPDMPDFFGSHRIPEKGSDQLKTRDITTVAAGGNRRGFGGETGSNTILNSFTPTDLTPSESQGLFQGVITGNKMVNDNP